MAQEVSKADPSLAPFALDIARNEAANLITGLSEAKRKRVNVIIRMSVLEGWSEGEVAERLSRVVGLDQRGAQAVENLRRGLVERGTRPGVANQRAREHAKKLRAQRARLIAQYEMAVVRNGAQRALWNEQIEMGEVPPTAVREWVINKGACEVCQQFKGARVPVMAGMYAGSPNINVIGPPLHPNCRCTERLIKRPRK